MSGVVADGAAVGKMQVGDVIVALNARLIGTYTHNEAIDAISTHDKARFTVIRSDEAKKHVAEQLEGQSAVGACATPDSPPLVPPTQTYCPGQPHPWFINTEVHMPPLPNPNQPHNPTPFQRLSKSRSPRNRSITALALASATLPTARSSPRSATRPARPASSSPTRLWR